MLTKYCAVCAPLQSHVWLCDHMTYSLPGSSVHGIFQAKILTWVVISYSTLSISYLQFILHHPTYVLEFQNKKANTQGVLQTCISIISHFLNFAFSPVFFTLLADLCSNTVTFAKLQSSWQPWGTFHPRRFFMAKSLPWFPRYSGQRAMIFSCAMVETRECCVSCLPPSFVYVDFFSIGFLFLIPAYYVHLSCFFFFFNFGFLVTWIFLLLFSILFFLIAIIKKSTKNKCWRGCGEEGTLLWHIYLKKIFFFKFCLPIT